ncbi:MAG: hypothetical protein M0P71_01740 [Melioribacteraceae bacterium]|nr:hypothetical protein [Melioribacteraceae bacterium]
MAVIGKPFDKKLYDTYNDYGIFIAKSFLKQFNIDLLLGEKYKVDCYFIGKHSGISYDVEVEVRPSEHWNGTDFKYKTLTIPARKEKFVTKRGLYFAICEAGALFVIDFEFIAMSPKIIKKNKCNHEEEIFYEVDLSNCKFFKYKGSTWEKQ